MLDILFDIRLIKNTKLPLPEGLVRNEVRREYGTTHYDEDDVLVRRNL
jgi:hypothetical protein